MDSGTKSTPRPAHSPTREALERTDALAPWTRDAPGVLEELKVTRESGLADDEVTSRRQRFGPNRLSESKTASAWKILVAQLRSIIVLLLGIAAAVSFALGDHLEGAAMIAVVVLNAVIGFVTELRAVRSMEALRRMTLTSAGVRRHSHVKKIAAEELVPGDIVIIEAGDIVPADLRILEASKLQTDESALTGESVPVEKNAEAVAGNAVVSDRTCMLFSGTIVTRGSGEGVVVATGMNSELGGIARLVEGAEEESTPLEQRLAQLGRKLVWVTLAVAAVTAGTGVWAGKEFVLMIQTSLALAVAAIPEGLPVVATLALARGLWRMARRNALVNRLSAVETLGATSVIFTDKTGTLTENRLTVVRYALPTCDVFTDVFPALALGMSEGDENVMERRPRDAGEPVLSRRHWFEVLGYAGILTATVLAAYLIALYGMRMNPQQAVTVSFLVLAFGQVWHVFNMRDRGSPLWRNDVVRNRYVWLAVSICLLLLLAAVYVPLLAGVLKLCPPDHRGWLLVAGFSLITLLVGQAAKCRKAFGKQPGITINRRF